MSAAPELPAPPAWRAVNDVVLALAEEREVEPVLQRLVDAARELAGARYAALGVPAGDGAFARFITSGMSDELIARMGPLPRTHGLLGAMLESPEPYRTTDIRADPRFRGWWPRSHPQMRSFLGVPIVARRGIIGAFYLTDKEGAPAFGDGDQRTIETLAAHAAVAIENARLHERSRELSILEERTRLARELHDAVSQKLFGVVLTAESASSLAERDPVAAREQLDRLQALAREAMAELRGLIDGLRPPSPATEGLAPALRKHVAVLGRISDAEVELRLGAPPRLAPAAEEQVFLIAREALQNALRHGAPQRVTVSLEQGAGGALVLAVGDDGRGFDTGDPEPRARRLGLTSMEERAAAAGGTLAIESAPGRGTTVRLEVPA